MSPFLLSLPYLSRSCTLRRAFPITLLSLLTSSMLPAAEPAQPVVPPTRLAPVVVQGRETDLIGVATSASQGIVGARDLESRPLFRRGELLEVVPGVVITQHSGGGKANQYYLRGFNLDHGTDFSVAVDGMPVNLRSHAHGQGYADLNFLIPELVRQVDYNKGPFHADVGDFSGAGAAAFQLFERLPLAFASLALGGNGHARLVAAGTRLTDGAATTAALEYTHDDGPWVLPEDFNRYNGLLRRTWTAAGAAYSLTAMAYRGRWRATDQIPRRAVEDGTLDRFGHVDGSDGGESSRASLSFNATWPGAAAVTHLQVHAIHYRLNLFSNFTYFLDDPVNGDQFNQRDRRWLLGGALSRTWSGPRGTTTLGAQLRADSIGELGLHRTSRRVRLATVRDDAVDEASLGGFLRNETRWRDGLRTETGLRADVHRFEVASSDARNSGSRQAARVSPKLGLILGPWRGAELYANVGYGFHSNDARGTTIRIDPADGVTPVERATPLVRSRGAELGVRTAPAPGLVTSLALWALELDSELVFVGDAGGTEAAGGTRRHGVELANHWRLRPWLALEGDVALTRARYREDTGAGTRVANAIGTVVTAGVALGAERGWFGGVRLRAFSCQPLVEDGSVRAPTSVTMNLRAGWRARTWEASLEVQNLFDRANNDITYHYASRLPGEDAEGVEDVHFHPAEPLTLRVAVTRRF